MVLSLQYTVIAAAPIFLRVGFWRGTKKWESEKQDEDKIYVSRLDKRQRQQFSNDDDDDDVFVPKKDDKTTTTITTKKHLQAPDHNSKI